MIRVSLLDANQIESLFNSSFIIVDKEFKLFPSKKTLVSSAKRIEYIFFDTFGKYLGGGGKNSPLNSPMNSPLQHYSCNGEKSIFLGQILVKVRQTQQILLETVHRNIIQYCPFLSKTLGGAELLVLIVLSMRS